MNLLQIHSSHNIHCHSCQYHSNYHKSQCYPDISRRRSDISEAYKVIKSPLSIETRLSLTYSQNTDKAKVQTLDVRPRLPVANNPRGHASVDEDTREDGLCWEPDQLRLVQNLLFVLIVPEQRFSRIDFFFAFRPSRQ